MKGTEENGKGDRKMKTKMKTGILVGWALVLVCAVGAQVVLDTGAQTQAFGPGKGRGYTVALRPEWGVLTLRTRMKTTDLVRGREGWMNGRIPMSFHDKTGKRVGPWPNVFGFEVVGSRVDGRHHKRVFVDAFAGYLDDALTVEVPRNAAHFSDGSARFREERAHLRRGAVAVVGHDFDHDGDAVRPVAFVEDDLHLSAELAGAALDSTLDVVHGDVARAGCLLRL